MGVRKRQRAVRAMRGQMWSPGRPSTARREDRVRFWEAIARGVSSEDAAARGRGVIRGRVEVVPAGWRDAADLVWPRCRAAICPSPSGRRSRSCTRSSSGCARSPAASAGRRRRSRGSCAATRRRARIGWTYRATTAQWHAERRASRPKVAKLAANDRLREYVQDRLAGTIARPDGELVPGPEVRFIGRRHGRRADRRWAKSWSPEQISNRLRVDFPDDESMRISHEAIYQALYVQGRGALKRELVACLRTGRALRVPRARTRGAARSSSPRRS